MWKDPWIRDQNGEFITWPLQHVVEDKRVSDLIDHNTGEWKVNEVNTYFDQQVAKLILVMPIYREVGEDKCVWKFTSHGEYSVRSAYHYIMENLVDNSDLRVTGNWMRIWKMQVPQKIKVFLWRAARGCLPTRERLRTRGVQYTDRCVHCERSFENDWHVFFGCNKVEEVWAEVGLWNFIRDRLKIANGFIDLFFQLLELLSQQNLHMFAMTLWCIWKRRNEKLWNDVDIRPDVSVRLARESLVQWQQVRRKQQQMQAISTHSSGLLVQNNTSTIRWEKPAPGEVKCNVDMAIFKDQGCYGVGMCLRDENGHFIAAKTV
jgi:hypothetical protein